MHEMAIAQGVLDITLDNAAQSGAKKVISIKLLVGQMTGVEPEALRFCFSALAEGTVAAEAVLVIVNAPLVCLAKNVAIHARLNAIGFYAQSADRPKLKLFLGGNFAWSIWR